MKVYSPPSNHQLAKILFAATLSRTPINHEPVPYGYKHRQFQQNNALFTTPALETGPHQYVFGTHAILRAIGPQQSNLTPFQQSLVNQWLELIEKDLEPAVGVLILLTNHLAEVKQEQTSKAKEAVVRIAKQLDQRLKLNTFLVGTSLTIADISAYYSWTEICSLVEKETKQLTNLHRWVKHIASIPKK